MLFAFVLIPSLLFADGSGLDVQHAENDLVPKFVSPSLETYMKHSVFFVMQKYFNCVIYERTMITQTKIS